MLTDYQVLVTLTGSFDFAHASNDGSDVRITAANDAALPFWIETWNPGANLARIWVRVPSIPTTGTTIYLYYGNPAASSTSSGGDAFEFFDNDWTSLTSRWHINGGTPVVNSGVVSFASGATMQTVSTYLPGHALGYRGWFKSGGGLYKWGGFLNGVNIPYTYIGTVGDAGYPSVVLTNNTTGTRGASDLGLPTDTFHIYELAWTSSVVRAFLDRATSPAGSLTQYIPTSALPIQLGNYNDNTPTGETFDVDWVYLRHYQEPEPTATTGAEEGNQSADLELTLSDSPDPMMVGHSLTYAFTITNHGPLGATAVVLSDNLPASVTFYSASANQGTCNGTTTVTCNLGDIANSGTATVSIVVLPTTAGTIVNSASVSSATTDYNTANNNASASTIANDSTSADLAITQSDTPDPVKAGQALTYTLAITNNGPADATDVTMHDTLPANATYVAATADQGTCTHPGEVICNIGTMSSGSTAHITIVVTPTAIGTITNQATVSGLEVDPYLANNATSETTRVSAPSLGAVVLVNSNSAAYGDFSHFIQPYLDHFGVPYTVLDIATTAVGSDVAGLCGDDHWSPANRCGQHLFRRAVLEFRRAGQSHDGGRAGAGLINFDNDLSATARLRATSSFKTSSTSAM